MNKQQARKYIVLQDHEDRQEQKSIASSKYQLTPDEYVISEGSFSVGILELNTAKELELRKRLSASAIAELMPISLVGEQPLVERESSLRESWNLKAIGIENTELTGRGVRVALLDSGVQPDHPAFSSVRLRGKNFTNSGRTSDWRDEHGHGTHCAGIIFGGDFNGRRIGIAKEIAAAHVYKVAIGKRDSPNDTIDQLISALNQAFRDEVNVISISIRVDPEKYMQQLYINEPQALEPMFHRTAFELRRNQILLRNTLARIRRQNPDVNPFICAATGNQSVRSDGVTASAKFPASLAGISAVGALNKIHLNTPATNQRYKVWDKSNTNCDFVAQVFLYGQRILEARCRSDMVQALPRPTLPELLLYGPKKSALTLPNLVER